MNLLTEIFGLFVILFSFDMKALTGKTTIVERDPRGFENLSELNSL
jgi:hypothetical protein